ncbi:MAG: PoNe immunity protein domain-containing protein [Campylobacteraceae bacterium]
MIRAPWGDKKYWDEKFVYFLKIISENLSIVSQPSKNPMYRPQFTFDTMLYHLRVMFIRYSRGDNISELPQYFSGLIDMWELSNKLAKELNETLKKGEGWDHRHISPRLSSDKRAHDDPRAWIFSLTYLNHYNLCFWLVGLAILLDIDENLWQRLLRLIDEDGEDILLDRVIAYCQKDRKIGDKLLHKKPYQRLLKAIDAPKEKQAVFLYEFVENWYKELERKGDDELWWYIFGDPVKQPLSMGSYFGRWCIEATVCVKVFNMDDSLCLKNEYYPKAFLHEEKAFGVFDKLKSLFRK